MEKCCTRKGRASSREKGVKRDGTREDRRAVVRRRTV